MDNDPTVIQYWDELTDDERKDRYRWLYEDKERYQLAYRELYKQVDEVQSSFVEPYGEGFKCTECGASNIVQCMLIHRVGCTADMLSSAMAHTSVMLPDD